VTPASAVALFKHLEAQGRSKGGVGQLTHMLIRALERAWETSEAKRFSDQDGGGWFVDLSDYCDGEMLYGVVRSGPGGSRTLDTVVDADTIESWQRGKPGALAASLPDETSASGPARSHPREDEGLREDTKPRSSPLDPMLVVIAVPESASGHAPHEKIMRCTRAEAPGLIAKLLRLGLNGTPLAEDQIEIWSAMSKPKLEITF
jgi:hypothetical protein